VTVHVEITLPDGGSCERRPRRRRAGERGCRPSRPLESLRPADDLDHYRRGAPDSDDIVAELRGIFGREADEPFPDFSVFPPIIAEFESPPGTYYDAFPLMVMTKRRSRRCSAALPESNVDIRRFRPSLVIDTGDDGAEAGTPGHPEFDWSGRGPRSAPRRSSSVRRARAA
jgi:hypothetical protein